MFKLLPHGIGTVVLHEGRQKLYDLIGANGTQRFCSRCTVVFSWQDLTVLSGPCHAQAPEERRHLLRWWVDSDANYRSVAPAFAPRSSARPEGGFYYDAGTQLRLPFYPYDRHDGEGQSPY